MQLSQKRHHLRYQIKLAAVGHAEIKSAATFLAWVVIAHAGLLRIITTPQMKNILLFLRNSCRPLNWGAHRLIFLHIQLHTFTQRCNRPNTHRWFAGALCSCGFFFPTLVCVLSKLYTCTHFECSICLQFIISSGMFHGFEYFGVSISRTDRIRCEVLDANLRDATFLWKTLDCLFWHLQ